MFPTLRNFSWALIFCGVLAFVLGISTFFWSETQGFITKYEVTTLVQNGYVGGNGVSVYRGGLVSHWQRVVYSFNVNGERMESGFIGFFVPVNVLSDRLTLDGTLKSNSVKIYYLKSFPQISVLQQGFDWRVVISCLVIGVGLLAFRNQCIEWVKNA